MYIYPRGIRAEQNLRRSVLYGMSIREFVFPFRENINILKTACEKTGRVRYYLFFVPLKKYLFREN